MLWVVSDYIEESKSLMFHLYEIAAFQHCTLGNKNPRIAAKYKDRPLRLFTKTKTEVFLYLDGFDLNQPFRQNMNCLKFPDSGHSILKYLMDKGYLLTFGRFDLHRFHYFKTRQLRY